MKEKTRAEGETRHVSGQSNRPLSLPAHSLTLEQTVAELQTDTWSGLDATEAKHRLDKYGANDLGDAESASVFKILVAQVANAITARVIRGGQQTVVPSAEVVPGDVIEIKTGDTIPADIR
jgi:P-type Na+/K+ transporter